MRQKRTQFEEQIDRAYIHIATAQDALSRLREITAYLNTHGLGFYMRTAETHLEQAKTELKKIL